MGSVCLEIKSKGQFNAVDKEKINNKLKPSLFVRQKKEVLFGTCKRVKERT
jgi:endonuclease III